MMGERDTCGSLDAVQTIDLAVQRTRYMLFEPFLYSKWLNFGVMIFLSLLAGGGGGLTNYASPFISFSGFDPEGAYRNAESYVLDNLSTILVMAVPLFAVVAIIVAGFMYLGARGTMMVIRAVADDDEDIGSNWSAVAAPAWTYFVFHLEMVIALTAYLMVAGLAGFFMIRLQMSADVPEPGLIVGIVVVVVVTIAVSIAYGLAMFAMRNFIAPLIYHFRYSSTQAWGEFFAIARDNPGHMLLYLLIKAVFSMVLGIGHTLAIYCTCCIGMLPVLNQAILSPLYVFERSYSLYALGSLGPDYAVIQEPPPPEPPSLPPVINAPPAPDINHEVS